MKVKAEEAVVSGRANSGQEMEHLSLAAQIAGKS
jgi:hypothetical protein